MIVQDGITVVLALVIRNAGPLPVIRNEKLPGLIMKRAVALLLIMKHATPPNHQRNNASGNE